MMLFLVRDKMRTRTMRRALCKADFIRFEGQYFPFRSPQLQSALLMAAGSPGAARVTEGTSRRRSSALAWAVPHLLQFARPVLTGGVAGVPLNTHLECRGQAGLRSDGLQT